MLKSTRRDMLASVSARHCPQGYFRQKSFVTASAPARATDGCFERLEAILDRHDDLTIARAIYRERVEQFPGRLIMLCDRARPSLEHSVCDESVDNPDYHDSR